MKRIQALLAVAALAAVTAGHAATIDVTWGNPVFAPPNADTVGVTITAPAFANGSIPIGRMQGTGSAPNPAGVTVLFPTWPDIYAYCYDLLQTLNPGETITYTLSLGADPDVLNFLGAANAFLGGGTLAWLNPVATGIYTAAEVAAAIQLGIWEGLYENNSFVLGAGNIQFSGVDADVAGAYAAIIAQLGSADLAGANVVVLNSRTRQDAITGTEEQFDIPEPATLVLIGLAALAGGIARRRME